MSNFMVALLVGLGVAGWIYGKMMRRTGGITQNALIVAGTGGLFAFLIVLIIANSIL